MAKLAPGYFSYIFGFLIMVLFGTFILSYISDAFRSIKDFVIFLLISGPLFGIFYAGAKTFQKGHIIIETAKNKEKNCTPIPISTIFSNLFKLLALGLFISTGSELFQALFYISKNGTPNDINVTSVFILKGINIVFSIALFIFSLFIEKKFKNKLN